MNPVGDFADEEYAQAADLPLLETGFGVGFLRFQGVEIGSLIPDDDLQGRFPGHFPTDFHRAFGPMVGMKDDVDQGFFRGQTDPAPGLLRKTRGPGSGIDEFEELVQTLHPGLASNARHDGLLTVGYRDAPAP
ncbi:MAG: hypothetical protein MZV63_47055, partial [Marinilabiliales bacterium]|nr:hypothetical protein [Marinilabiliales bacterium]